MAKSTRSFLVHVITIIRSIGPVSDLPYDIDRRKIAIEASWKLLFLTRSIQGPSRRWKLVHTSWLDSLEGIDIFNSDTRPQKVRTRPRSTRVWSTNLVINTPWIENMTEKKQRERPRYCQKPRRQIAYTGMRFSQGQPKDRGKSNNLYSA